MFTIVGAIHFANWNARKLTDTLCHRTDSKWPAKPSNSNKEIERHLRVRVICARVQNVDNESTCAQGICRSASSVPNKLYLCLRMHHSSSANSSESWKTDATLMCDALISDASSEFRWAYPVFSRMRGARFSFSEKLDESKRRLLEIRRSLH